MEERIKEILTDLAEVWGECTAEMIRDHYKGKRLEVVLDDADEPGINVAWNCISREELDFIL